MFSNLLVAACYIELPLFYRKILTGMASRKRIGFADIYRCPTVIS
jgi:hypothetical protein